MKFLSFCAKQNFDAIYSQIDFVGENLKSGRKQYVIVPDHFSLTMEKLLMERLELVATFDLEVVSIARLCSRVLKDNDKKVLGMLDAIILVEYLLKANKEKFLAFKHLPVSSGFAKILFDTISQLKACNITPSMFEYSANNLPDGNLKQKILDIAKVYELYENYIKDKFVDSNSRINLFCQSLKTTEMFLNADIHFCGFFDYTAQDYEVIKNLIKKSHLVSVTAIIPNEGQKNEDFYLKNTFVGIKSVAQSLGIELEEIKCESCLKGASKHILDNLFALEIETKKENNISLFSAENIDEEVLFVAKSIIKLLGQGVKPSDIVVNCSDLSLYNSLIEMTFSKYKIPFWIDQNITFSNTEYYKFLKSVFDVVLYGFMTDDVLKVFLNGLSPLSEEQKQSFVKYAKKFGIMGSMWTNDITISFDDEEFLLFEQTKKQFLSTLKDFSDYIKENHTIGEFCEKVKWLKDAFLLDQKAEQFSLEFEDKGKLKQSSVFRQSQEKFDKILSSMQNVLSDQQITFLEWVDIFDTSASITEIIPLPMGLENVFVGGMLSSCFEPKKYYFVLGATEENLPAYSKDVGIISDSDIAMLDAIKLEPTVLYLNKKTEFTVMQNLTLFLEKMIITCPHNIKDKETQESVILKNLSKMFDVPIIELSHILLDDNAFFGTKQRLKFLLSNEKDALKYLIDNKDKIKYSDKMQKFALEICKKIENFDLFSQKKEDYISNAPKMFFANGFTKATELERYFSCPFLHFVEYGLKLKDKEQNTVRPVDIGNILHDLVERFAKYSKGNILKDEQIEKFAKNTFSEIIHKKEYEHLLMGADNKALAKGLETESVRILKAINYQNSHSKFRIVFAEKSFGDKEFVPMPEILVYNTNQKLKLKGKVDRVDFCDKKFRVVDYKTGKLKADFDMLDLYLGKKIQLFIYLYAMREFWKDKNPMAAFYFPLHNDYLEDEPISPYETYCMNGVMVDSYENLYLQDDTLNFENNKSGIVGFSLNNKKELATSGTLSIKPNKNLASQEEFLEMINYSYKVFSKALAEILEGFIKPKPLEDSCTYCMAKSFCPNYKNKPQFREKDFAVTKQTFKEIANE